MVQTGSKNIPIIVTPRINGAVVTQTEIKTVFSNAYVDDVSTPLSFSMELKRIGGDTVTGTWDSDKSSETKLYFTIPDTVYATNGDYTVVVYWTINTEINSVIAPYHLTVEDLHTQ